MKANSFSGKPASSTGRTKPVPAQQGRCQGASAELWQEYTPEGAADHQDPKPEQCQPLLLAQCPIPCSFTQGPLWKEEPGLNPLDTHPPGTCMPYLDSLSVCTTPSCQASGHLTREFCISPTAMTSHIPAQASSIPSFHQRSVWPTKPLLKTWRSTTCSWKRQSSPKRVCLECFSKKTN